MYSFVIHQSQDEHEQGTPSHGSADQGRCASQPRGRGIPVFQPGLVYGSGSQADNSSNLVTLLTASPSLSHSPLLCLPSPAPLDPVLPEQGTAEDVDTSMTVQGESSPTPTTLRSNQRGGTAALFPFSPAPPPHFHWHAPQDVSPTPATPCVLVSELSSPTPSLEALGNQIPTSKQSPLCFLPVDGHKPMLVLPPPPPPHQVWMQQGAYEIQHDGLLRVKVFN